MIKPGMKIAIFDIGGANCICKVYEITEYEGKKRGTCVRSLSIDTFARGSGRDIDEIIIEEIENSIPEDKRNTLKIKTLEAAKKIKHDLSSQEKIT